jgi:2-amino-4-hydroxy-6-hydroxymethyldihydropteridine diphosphokinase
MKTNIAIISLGSNIDPEVHIPRALNRLKQDHTLISVSQKRQTQPLGNPNQPDFINLVVLIETSLNLLDLTSYLKHLEDESGRDRDGGKWGPRTLDLDVVVWNQRVIDSDVHTRPFLHAAVLEIAPELTV